MDLKKNFSLVVAVALPIIMVLALAVAIYIPGTAAKPTVDFLYMYEGAYGPSEYYEIRDNKLTKVPLTAPSGYEKPMPVTGTTPPRFYLYHVATDTSEEIDFAKAATLSLDQNYVSRDGFTVQQGDGGQGIFDIFGSNRDYSSIYLEGKKNGVRLSISQTSTNGYFRFLGWIN